MSATPTSAVSGPVALAPETRRVVSVDALRGFDMFWILGADALVQSFRQIADVRHPVPEGWLARTVKGTAEFFGTQLEHADWVGFRFYDLIFPLFVFIVGVSIVFSLGRAIERDGSWGAHKRVFRRFALLFVLALIYSGGVSHEWPNVRLMGVLNRIALCYLFASLLFLHLPARGLAVATGVLLIGYWALMTFVPVPEIGAGSFAKGANLANWIDAQYLPGRKWDGTWDPEGLLSTLPAIASCLLGVLAGLLLRDVKTPEQRKVLVLMGGGAIAAALGFAWGVQFPVIKKIWTSSFVLVAGGFSAILLGVFHQIIDVWGYQRWARPFVWIGANAITLYFANNIIGFKRVAQRFAGGDVKAYLDRKLVIGMGDLLLALVGLLLAVALAWFLYRRKIFLRV